LLGGVVLVALVLWGIYRGMWADLQKNDTDPIKRIEERPTRK